MSKLNNNDHTRRYGILLIRKITPNATTTKIRLSLSIVLMNHKHTSDVG